MPQYLQYSADIEDIAPDEAETFEKIAETFRSMGEKVADTAGRRLRVSHAKPTALLDAELTIEPRLPPELAQGLAAQPGQYAAQIRFAQGPGELLDDSISTHRGMTVRVTGLPGDSIPEAIERGTQDFVLEGTGRAFINATASRFLANLKAGVSNAPSVPQGVKQVVRNVARGAEVALESVGLEAKTLSFFGHPKSHPLAEPYFSQVPMRWGDYVAKVGFFPTEETLAGLAETSIDTGADDDAFHHAMQKHFAAHGATFELRVQLATDLRTTPIEDATVEWPQDETPYRTVARLTMAPQEAWTDERHDQFERRAFSPANSLTAHRPLGQIMRARMFVYRQLSQWRRAGQTVV